MFFYLHCSRTTSLRKSLQKVSLLSHHLSKTANLGLLTSVGGVSQHRQAARMPTDPRVEMQRVHLLLGQLWGIPEAHTHTGMHAPLSLVHARGS